MVPQGIACLHHLRRVTTRLWKFANKLQGLESTGKKIAHRGEGEKLVERREHDGGARDDGQKVGYLFQWAAHGFVNDGAEKTLNDGLGLDGEGVPLKEYVKRLPTA